MVGREDNGSRSGNRGRVKKRPVRTCRKISCGRKLSNADLNEMLMPQSAKCAKPEVEHEDKLTIPIPSFSTSVESCFNTGLMDLPDEIIIQIMSHFDHDFLRDVACKVSLKWKQLAHTRVLWSQAFLEIKSPGHFEPFIRKIADTPYLHHLIIRMTLKETRSAGKYLDFQAHTKLSHDTITRLMEALLSCRSKIHKISLFVDDDNYKLMRFLLKHPELKEIEFWDESQHSDLSSWSSIIGRVVPRLRSLTLRVSTLLQKEAGLMLSSPSCPELPIPSDALDLRDTDEEQAVEPQGLQHFDCYWIRLIFLDEAIQRDMAKNLSAFIRAHKDTLKSVKFSLRYCPEVWTAVAECSQLEELQAVLDEDGSLFLSALPSLRHLRSLALTASVLMGPGGLTKVLRSLSQHAPPGLHTLKLTSVISIKHKEQTYYCQTVIRPMLPSFEPLRPLLVAGAAGAGPATLRELHLTRINFIGRAQLLELAAMDGLALRKLCVIGQAKTWCSPLRTWEDCRDRAVLALRAAAPSLEYVTVNDCVCG